MPHHHLPLSAPALASRRRPLAGEDEIYAKSRRALLVEEIHLRRRMEQIAEIRRALPPGPLVADHIFRKADHGYTSLSRLFGDKDILILYVCDFGSLGPSPICYHFLAALQGNLDALRTRTEFALASRSPAADVASFIEHHQWQPMLPLRIHDENFMIAFNLLAECGEFCPSLMVFRKTAEGVRLFWKSEMSADMTDEAETPSEMFDMASLWSILDITPQGRFPERPTIRDQMAMPVGHTVRPEAIAGRWPRPVYGTG